MLPLLLSLLLFLLLIIIIILLLLLLLLLLLDAAPAAVAAAARGRQTQSARHRQAGTIHRKHNEFWNSAGRAPSLRIIQLAFALQLSKKHGKHSDRVA
jgi:hypothetical protein